LSRKKYHSPYYVQTRTTYYYILFISIASPSFLFGLRKGSRKTKKTSELKNKISDALIIFLFRQFILIHGYLTTDSFFFYISSSRKFSAPAKIMIAFP
jgi:hypothetical protein